jgi:hypothetical protein
MNFAKLKIERGAALMEFAISFPLFLGIVFGMIDLSTLMIQKSQIEYAAQESLREASLESIECEKKAIELFTEKIKQIGVTLAPQPPKAEAITYYCSELDSTPTERKCSDDIGDPLYATNLFSSTQNFLKIKVNVKASCYICDIAFGFGDRLKTYKGTFSVPLNMQDGSIAHSCYPQDLSTYNAENCYNIDNDSSQC